jgi:precorrin-3B methylase
LVKDFTADVRELLEKEQLGGYEADVVPSLSAALTAFALVGAAAWNGGHKSKDDQ